MDFIANNGSLLFGTILPFLIVLTIVVFFHELGHYLVARWNDVGIQAFSIGFGPELYGFNDRHGTRWKLSAIPLGGYVKFIDDANEASAPASSKDLAQLEAQGLDKSKFLSNKKVWQRAAVVAAGPIANFLLSILIFAGVLFFAGKMITTAMVDDLIEGGVAIEAGFQKGDQIVAVDDNVIESFADLQRIVATNPELEMKFSVKRDGGIAEIFATPALQEVSDGLGNTQRVGRLGISRSVSPEAVIHKTFGPVESLTGGVTETYFYIKETVRFLSRLIVGRESVDQLGGPIRIAEVTGKVAAISIFALINLTAILSVSIGFLNLLPIPMLDGGHLVFYALEAIRGQPLPEKVQEYSFRVGLALVLSLMLFVTVLDISRLIP